MTDALFSFLKKLQVAQYGLQLFLCFSLVISGCASTQGQRTLSKSRESFNQGQFDLAEKILRDDPSLTQGGSRVLVLAYMGSAALEQGQYEKAAKLFHLARESSKDLRSSRGQVDFFRNDYLGTPIDFSYLHSALGLSYLFLAQSEGPTVSAEITELKDSSGRVLLEHELFPSRTLTESERRQFLDRAKAEMLSLDSHYQDLRRSFPNRERPYDDVFGRVLASLVHQSFSDPKEKRISEILLGKLVDEGRVSEDLKKVIVRGDQNVNFWIDIGTVPELRRKKVLIGLSTLLGASDDPQTRRLVDEVGIRVILQTAPEFGLIALGSAMVGAATQDSDDEPVRFLSDAIDEGMGLVLEISEMKEGKGWSLVDLKIQKKDSTELNSASFFKVEDFVKLYQLEDRGSQMTSLKEQAFKKGAGYLSILIPAIIAYQKAARENNTLMRLGVLAGFYVAKRSFDAATRADLRSYALLPESSWFSSMRLPQGQYEMIYELKTTSAKFESEIRKGSFGFQVEKEGRKTLKRFRILP